MGGFAQDGPRLTNTFTGDAALRAWLATGLPDDVAGAIAPGLEALGERAATGLHALAARAEAEPPRLVRHDPWGERIDRIETSPAWDALLDAAAEEGIVATGWEREHGPFSRLHQLVRLYLYHPSSAIASCPLAMTDGAARVIELHGDDDLRDRVLPRLVSRDPERAWTSGQWMTERTGGSDVSKTSTRARPADDGSFPWRLHGEKWFASATTAETALALAREEETGDLSLFYVETREPDGSWNAIRVRRLKDKLGTRAMPTAELELVGTPARRIGEPGRGVATVATMLNVTRLYNAVCSAGSMRRAVALARDYATRRIAFGRRLIDHPLHAETLADLETEARGALHLALWAGELLGREETGEADDDERATLRLLTPVTKLFTARRAVAVTSEAIEAFGGAGYVEDTGLPVLLRDVQVLPIWEGTTNVLALDAIRAMRKEDAHRPLLAALRRRLSRVDGPLADPAERTAAAIEELAGQLDAGLESGPETLDADARRLAFGLARTAIAALLLDHAARGGAEPSEAGHPSAVEAARRWCAAPLVAARPGSPGTS